MTKWTIIIILLIISVIAFYFYLTQKLPAGVEPKGSESTVALISLITAIVSLAGTILTLVLKIMELKLQKQKQS